MATKALLILTFGPVQAFIEEARRAGDLYAGSQILVELANAAGSVFKNRATLIYPDASTRDTPNRLVAQAEDYDQAEVIVQAAEDALHDRWQMLAGDVFPELQKLGVDKDQWKQQLENYWEVYWAAAPIPAKSADPKKTPYQFAYDQASALLEAAKRSRRFAPAEEVGPKDSLSGQRAALRPKELWEREQRGTGKVRAQLGKRQGKMRAYYGSVLLRPTERLDALGAVKRLGEWRTHRFQSTSDVAAADFRKLALEKTSSALRDYRDALIDAKVVNKPEHDEDWHTDYDGDLLYLETLTPRHLKDDYGAEVGESQCATLRKKLADVYDTLREKLRADHKTAHHRPCKYYAIIALDGDSMGKLVGQHSHSADKHRAFSATLSQFASEAQGKIADIWGDVIYNGGDDVLVFAPLSRALACAQRLAAFFNATVKDGSLSGGIAIVHHTYPLGAALRAARQAEKTAKRQVKGKAAVCVSALKRSGEPILARSAWEALGDNMNALVTLFQEDQLSSKFAYDLAREVDVVTTLEPAARQAMLTLWVKRHTSPSHQAETSSVPGLLGQWSVTLDTLLKDDYPQPGLREVARWALLARFIAQGGGGE